MAKVNESAMKKWTDGETIHAAEYNNERNLIVRALNDTDARVDELGKPFSVDSTMIVDGAITPTKIIKESVIQFTYDQAEIRKRIADAVVEGIPQEVIDEIIAGAAESIGNHVNDTVKHVTAADHVLINSIVDKDTAILTAAKKYIDDKVWQKAKLTADDGKCILLPAGTNLNNLFSNGQYNGDNLVGGPQGLSPTTWLYIEVLTHTNGLQYSMQRASILNGAFPTLFMRICEGGVWKPWSDDLFQSVVNGKSGIATAVNDMRPGFGLSPLAPFAEMATAIRGIKGGVKSKFGNIATNIAASGAPVTKTIPDIAFVPRCIIIDTTLTTPTGEQSTGWLISYDVNNSSRSVDTAGGYVGASISEVVKGSNFVTLKLSQSGTVQGTVRFSNYYILGD